MRSFYRGDTVLGGYTVEAKANVYRAGDGVYVCRGGDGARYTLVAKPYLGDAGREYAELVKSVAAIDVPGMPHPVYIERSKTGCLVLLSDDLARMHPATEFACPFDPAGGVTVPPGGYDADMLKYVLVRSAELLSKLAENKIIHRGVASDCFLYNAGEGTLYVTGFMTEGSLRTGYCPEEQYFGRTVTPSADVYAWAVCAMELIAGKYLPQSGMDAGRKRGEYIAQMSGRLPEGMAELLERCLDGDPGKRPRWDDIIPLLRESLCVAGECASLLRPMDDADYEGPLGEREKSLATDDTTTDDGMYKLGERLSLDPPFAAFEAVNVKTGKRATVLTVASKGDEDAKELMYRRFENNYNASENSFAGKKCPYIIRWSKPHPLGDDFTHLVYGEDYGESLSGFLEREAPLDTDTALELTVQLLDALASAHSAGTRYMGQGDYLNGGGPWLVHGHISQRTIRISEQNGDPVMLLDGFECAWPLRHKHPGLIPDKAERENRRSYRKIFRDKKEKGLGEGAFFMPREQLAGRELPKPAWDVWAAAACFYFMLTGEYPRKAPNDAPVPVRERRGDIPEALAATLDAALDDRHGLRYAAAEELRDELEKTRGVKEK